MNPVSFIEDCYTIYIDEEKGTVVAKLEEREFISLLIGEAEYFYSKCGADIDMSDFSCDIITKLLVQSEIPLVAKAKCNFDAGEVWDKDYGVELAVRRLTNQILHLERKFWLKMEEKIGVMFNRAAHHVDTYEHRLEHNRRKLDELKN